MHRTFPATSNAFSIREIQNAYNWFSGYQKNNARYTLCAQCVRKCLVNVGSSLLYLCRQHALDRLNTFSWHICILALFCQLKSVFPTAGSVEVKSVLNPKYSNTVSQKYKQLCTLCTKYRGHQPPIADINLKTVS